MARFTYAPAMENGVFPHEGGYTNDPRDPGGPTNWGITIFDARKYWKPSATAADMKTMPRSVAEAIYWPHYAVPMCYDRLAAGVDYTILDYAINSGVGRSGKVLRRVLGLSDSTWQVTDDVVAASLKRDPMKLIDAICDERQRFLEHLSTFDHFGPGWTRRVREVRAMAKVFSTQGVPEQPVRTSSSGEMAKGVVPLHPVVHAVVKNKVKVAGAGCVAGAGWATAARDFVAQHPLETTAIAIGSVMVVGGGIYAIERWHKAKQEAPTPGIVPVPVAA